MFSFILLVLLHRPFFCHVTSATVLTWLVETIDFQALCHLCPMNLAWQYHSVWAFFIFLKIPTYPEALGKSIICSYTICAHRVMYLSLPELDTLACGASPVTCGGLLHMSTGTDILPTGWESQPCLVMSQSSLVNLIWLGFWEQSDGLTLGWILQCAPLQEVLIYLLSWLWGDNPKFSRWAQFNHQVIKGDQGG